MSDIDLDAAGKEHERQEQFMDEAIAFEEANRPKLTEQQQQIRKLLAEAGDIPSADVESYELDFCLAMIDLPTLKLMGYAADDDGLLALGEIFQCEWDCDIKSWFQPGGPNA
jgi:hypothetical protein